MEDDWRTSTPVDTKYKKPQDLLPCRTVDSTSYTPFNILALLSVMVKILDQILSILTTPWADNFNFDPTSRNSIFGCSNSFVNDQNTLNIRPHSPQACLYPQSCWPSDDAWTQLNKSLGGELYRARPPAYVCHEPFYNGTECDTTKKYWTSQFWRAEQPGGYFDAITENGDSHCDINGNSSTPCSQGLVPIFVAKVRDVKDVQKAVRFASRYKLSTRVKGASHDILGRSSGNGTFGISTINLKGIGFVDDFQPQGAPWYSTKHPAVHVAAGEQWLDVYKAADKKEVVIVGGNSYSTGAAGGWVLGGGHSSLSPQYGLGVDNVLEFEIVTPDGNFRTASRYREQNLFWALRGGGPGFGVVTRVTYKRHPAITEIVEILLNITYTPASYRNFLKTWLQLQPALNANRFSGYSYPTPNGMTADIMVHNSADNTTAAKILKPLQDIAEKETREGRPVDVQITSSVLPNYLSLYPSPKDIHTIQEGATLSFIGGGRLLPLDIFESQDDRVTEALIDTIVNAPVNQGYASVLLQHVAGHKVSEVCSYGTAVHPSWRSATHSLIFFQEWSSGASFEEKVGLVKNHTKLVQSLAKIVPGYGTYHNEADPNEPEWHKAFWGSNYDRLLSIKHRVDPDGIFTCRHCVGDRIETDSE